MNKVTYSMVALYITIVVGSAFTMHLKNEGNRTVAQVLHSKVMSHKCKVEMVEVTKTEGDLTWTDVEPMCK